MDSKYESEQKSSIRLKLLQEVNIDTIYLSVEQSSPNWLSLPHGITALIFQKLDSIEILENVQKVCTQWESICTDPCVWSKTSINLESSDGRSGDLWREAVNRSCDGLTDISINGLRYDDEFLDFVTEKCPKIRRFSLVNSSGISVKQFCKAASSLQRLEEFEISYCPLPPCVLNIIGGYFPLLKSLKLNKNTVKNTCYNDDDNYAIAISKNFTQLRHLQLSWNSLTDEGLEAILDCCPHLESLHLSQCFNIDLEYYAELKKRAETIQDFRNTLNYSNIDEFNHMFEDNIEDGYDSYDSREG